jgi:hypothetical protein
MWIELSTSTSICRNFTLLLHHSIPKYCKVILMVDEEYEFPIRPCNILHFSLSSCVRESHYFSTSFELPWVMFWLVHHLDHCGWNKVLATSFGSDISVLYPVPLLVGACAKKFEQKGYATGWGVPAIVFCLSASSVRLGGARPNSHVLSSVQHPSNYWL